jgi:hypothetical protein
VDEAKVHLDAVFFEISKLIQTTGNKQEAQTGQKRNRARAIFNEETLARRLKTKLSDKSEQQLHLAGGGGGLLRLLGLGGLRSRGLAEGNGGCAEDEREAEHRGHELFHRCILLELCRRL